MLSYFLATVYSHLHEIIKMGDEIATFEIEDLFQGKEFSFEKKISSSDVNIFANITGDNSPLHMDDGFAQERGFKGRVVHGGLLVGCISQLVGIHFPGKKLDSIRKHWKERGLHFPDVDSRGQRSVR